MNKRPRSSEFMNEEEEEEEEEQLPLKKQKMSSNEMTMALFKLEIDGIKLILEHIVNHLKPGLGLSCVPNEFKEHLESAKTRLTMFLRDLNQQRILYTPMYLGNNPNCVFDKSWQESLEFAAFVRAQLITLGDWLGKFRIPEETQQKLLRDCISSFGNHDGAMCCSLFSSTDAKLDERLLNQYPHMLSSIFSRTAYQIEADEGLTKLIHPIAMKIIKAQY